VHAITSKLARAWLDWRDRRDLRRQRKHAPYC